MGEDGVLLNSYNTTKLFSAQASDISKMMNKGLWRKSKNKQAADNKYCLIFNKLNQPGKLSLEIKES